VRSVFVNDAFERITGCSRDEVIGKPLSVLQGPGTDRQHLDRIRACLLAWQPVRAELLNDTKTGTPFWTGMDSVPVGNGAGWFTHWVSVERAVTERRQAEATQRLLHAQVQEAQRRGALGTPAGGVAHDFTPRSVCWPMPPPCSRCC
jgi:PAS domain S-box-containing protein